MTYTGASLITEIKALAKDTSLPDSLILGWLQETQDRVLGSSRLPQLECSTDEWVTTGGLSYDYPSDLQTILGLSLTNGTETLRPAYMAYQDFDAQYPSPDDLAAGFPQHYTDYGRTLYWNAPLDKNYNLKLKYLRRPTTVTKTATPDIPVEYKQILIKGALAGIEEYRENYDIAAVHLRKVEDLAEDFLTRYSPRQLVTPHKIKSSRAIRSLW
jgi:hypothetical protein